MKPARIALRVCSLLLAITVGACGGGGGDGPTLGGGISGTGKPVIRQGAVTAVGDVTIGGSAFDTSSATVTIGGMAATPADVRVGMVALLRGTDDGGVLSADDIVIGEVVKGIVEAVVDASTLTVQGQSVQVDETTVFGSGIAPASTAGLLVGDALEVYGFVKSPGVVSAARIEREAVLSEFRLVGFAAAVDPMLKTFSIGAQVVDYSGADTSDLAGGDPAAGQLVEVRGLTVLDMLGQLVATAVGSEDLDDEADNDDTEIEGFVTAVHSPTQIVVQGVTVNTSAATAYEGGVAADVVVGARVEVEGALASGALAATHVTFSDAIRIEADVADVVAGVITFVGLPGLTVTVSPHTQYEGAAASLGDVVAGDHLRVRGRATGPASVVATCIDERSPDTDVELQGPVDAVPAPSDPTFAILGVPVDTTGFAFGAFVGTGETAIGRAAFFGAIAPGTLVEAKGSLVGGVAVWDEVEIEGED